MKKTPPKDILDVYNEICDVLNIFVLNDNTKNFLKQDQSFQNAFLKNLSIINSIENEYNTKREDFDSILSAFKTITDRTEINIDSITNLNAIDMADDLNYLLVLLKNNLGLSIDDLKSGLSYSNLSSYQNNTESNFEKVEAEKVDMNNEFKNQQNNNANNAFINDFKNKFDLNAFADDLMATSAESILNKKIMTGEVYPYKTKPIIIPILKVLCIIFLLAILGLTIASSIFSQNATNSKVVIDKINDNQVYYNGGTIWFSLIFSILFPLFVIYSIFNTLLSKKTKNESVLYRFKYGLIIFYIVFIFLGGSLVLGMNSIFNWHQIKDKLISLNPDNEYGINQLQLVVYMEYAIFGCIGGLIITIIFGSILNPKIDIERMNELRQQILNDLKNGKYDPNLFSPQNPFSKFFGF